MKWPSLVNLLIGVLMILWGITHIATGPVAVAHVITGSVVALLSVVSILVPSDFTVAAYANFLCGIWVALAPLVLGYWYLLRDLANMEVAEIGRAHV